MQAEKSEKALDVEKNTNRAFKGAIAERYTKEERSTDQEDDFVIEKVIADQERE